MVMARIRSMVARHPKAMLLTALGGVALVAFAIYWFEPQALLIDKRVNEELPSATSEGGVQDADGGGDDGSEMDGGGDDREAESAPKVLADGALRGINHSATGRALLVRLGDGSHILRFEELMAENGPDLRVYLSAAPADSEGPAFNDDYVELGELKGNIGDQNYAIPANTALSKYRTPVIWCERFEVGFAVADVG
jgi:hypothetical protein